MAWGRSGDYKRGWQLAAYSVELRPNFLESQGEDSSPRRTRSRP